MKFFFSEVLSLKFVERFCLKHHVWGVKSTSTVFLSKTNRNSWKRQLISSYDSFFFSRTHHYQIINFGQKLNYVIYENTYYDCMRLRTSKCCEELSINVLVIYYLVYVYKHICIIHNEAYENGLIFSVKLEGYTLFSDRSRELIISEVWQDWWCPRWSSFPC